MKRFQIIIVNERKAGIYYDGIEAKGERPFLIIASNLSYNTFLACPLTSKINLNGKIKIKHANWIEVTFKKESYILLDQIVKFYYHKKDIYKIANYHLKKREIKEVINKTRTFLP